MDERNRWIAGVDYRICHSYIHKVAGTNRWGTWVCQCVYSNEFFVVNSLGPFALAACCSMSRTYRNLPDEGYRFKKEHDAIRFMSFINRFYECRGQVRHKAESFKLMNAHLLQPVLKAFQNNWDEHSTMYLEDFCTSSINPKKHQLLEWELTLIFNYLTDELEFNKEESYEISQADFFLKLDMMGGEDAVNRVLDHYSLITEVVQKNLQFWCFEEDSFTRLLAWDHGAEQRLVMSLAFLK